MYLSRKSTGKAVIAFLLAVVTYVSTTQLSFNGPAFLLYVVAISIAFTVLVQVGVEPKQEIRSPAEADHVLHERLTHDETEVYEYEHESRSLREVIAVFVMMWLFGVMSYAGLTFPLNGPLLLLLFGITFFVSTKLIDWVVAIENNSYHKVEKLVRRLDRNELDLLRTRLMEDQVEDEYDSMEELVQSGKRKNEVR